MAYPYQKDPNKIIWKIHFRSSPSKVYRFISTDQGRAQWWAESAEEFDGFIEFTFENNIQYPGKILSRVRNKRFSVTYFGKPVTFLLKADGRGGTDLTLSHAIPKNDPDRQETAAGWVSVLMAMKAAVDFGVDLRNHEAKRAWIFGYCDN